MRIFVHSSYHQPEHIVRPEAEIYVALAQQGHDIQIACEAGNYGYAQRFRAAGIQVIPAYPRKKIDFAHIRQLRQHLKQGVDIAIGYNSKTIPNLAFASIGLPHKVLAYRGTVGGLYRHDPSSYLTALHPKVDGIICVSKAVEEDVQKRSFLPHTCISTCYKGHHPHWYSGKKADLSQLGIPKEAFTIICVANARPSKGIEVLLSATQNLPQSQRVHLIFAGYGFDAPHYQALIANHPLKAQIHLLGHRQDIPELMAAADVQVQPSIKGEGLPKTVLEAMGSATPSIVTTTGGSQELIVHGESGFIVPTQDAPAIAQHLATLINQTGLSQQMGQAAQKRLATHFSLDKSVQDHLAFFEKMLHY